MRLGGGDGRDARCSAGGGGGGGLRGDLALIVFAGVDKGVPSDEEQRCGEDEGKVGGDDGEWHDLCGGARGDGDENKEHMHKDKVELARHVGYNKPQHDDGSRKQKAQRRKRHARGAVSKATADAVPRLYSKHCAVSVTGRQYLGDVQYVQVRREMATRP